MRVQAGAPSPLGATWTGRGTNFALFSAHAERITLCLFDHDGRERERIVLPEKSGDIWHGYLEEIRPGQHYGYRVHGPHDPERGFRFNPNKLLLDPYAKRISGRLVLDEVHFGHRYGDPKGDLSFDERDSASHMVKGVVADAMAPLQPRRPLIPWEDTIIYEAHVKGLTQLHNDVPAGWRGTFRALSSPEIVKHLKQLGVTSLELLPVHAFIDDWFVRQRGLHNYWGYNTLGFFVPDARYVGGDSVEIFRIVVDRMHEAGIEVILDVVYNHSCEGDHLGPTLSLRGIDNLSYYRLRADQPRYCENVTGCGNALNFAHPQVRQLAIDSLRFWAETFHVDGFRFDLAATLARGYDGFESDAPFFAAIRSDPVLKTLKLIAEPWDVGHDGYHAGDFPSEWSEWNDRFRRTVREFWLRDGNRLGEIARRLAGSSDLFQCRGRMPRASVNYVTAHDGFTLADLVSFSKKHNEKNLEGNHDGEDNNDSANLGVEGHTGNETVIAARCRLRKNFLATLMLAHGVPLMLAGDEVSNSQDGNNNAYCQDNETGWVDWTHLDTEGDDLKAFIGQLAKLRRRFPQLRAQAWLSGRHPDGRPDVLWLTPEGSIMSERDWAFPDARFLSYVLTSPQQGRPALYVVLNAARQTIAVNLPRAENRWTLEIDTSALAAANTTIEAGSVHNIPAQSVMVFSGGT